MRKIPTHLLYLQHFDHKDDENRMPDEYAVAEMMQINQGNHIPQCGDRLHSPQAYFCTQHLGKNVSGCSSAFSLSYKKMFEIKCSQQRSAVITLTLWPQKENPFAVG